MSAGTIPVTAAPGDDDAIPPARERWARAGWIVFAWLAFMGGLDPRLLMPWIAPEGPADVTARALTGAVLTIGVFRLAERFPWDGRRRARWAAAHALGAAAFVAASVGVLFAFHRRIHPGGPAGWGDALLSSLHWHLMLYGILVAMGMAIEASDRARRSEREAARLKQAASRLEAERTRARLDALRMQMQPHFLFNTLNAISELIHLEPPLAARTAAELRALLRLSLANAGAHEVPLEEELALLERYVAIQETRFGGGLEVTVEADAETRRALVPGLSLQPLVENALRHGVPAAAGGQRVEVAARREGDRLVLEVRDNGPGPGALRPGQRTGVGLANLRARLAHLHGDAARFELAGTARGTVARVELPFRMQTA